jgi:hypothetical protein
MRVAGLKKSLEPNWGSRVEDRVMRREPKAFGRMGSALACLCLFLGEGGCSLDKVVVPPLEGPSELGLSVKLDAYPDVIVADGHSTASIQATVRNENGQFVQGRQIFFSIASAEGIFADIGTLTSTTAFSGANGIAQVIYKAPPRTDATANQSVLVVARPVTSDANGAIYREVRIELRSAEPILFPQNPNNTAPTCGFTWEPSIGPEGGAYKVHEQILFQSTASDPDAGDTIIRYEWDFGDGSRPDDRDKPQANHAYGLPGTYTVSHVCTDRFGARGITTADFTIVP